MAKKVITVVRKAFGDDAMDREERESLDATFHDSVNPRRQVTYEDEAEGNDFASDDWAQQQDAVSEFADPLDILIFLEEEFA